MANPFYFPKLILIIGLLTQAFHRRLSRRAYEGVTGWHDTVMVWSPVGFPSAPLETSTRFYPLKIDIKAGLVLPYSNCGRLRDTQKSPKKVEPAIRVFHHKLTAISAKGFLAIHGPYASKGKWLYNSVNRDCSYQPDEPIGQYSCRNIACPNPGGKR